MVVRKDAEIAGLRRAGRATAHLLRELGQLAKPGVRLKELDDHAFAYMRKLGADPVFNTEAGFPAAINTSVNDVVLHGVPNDYVLQEGDLLSIDAGMRLDGFCGDSTITVAIGRIDPRHRRLMETARAAMEAGIAAARVGNRVGDIGHAMQTYAESRGYGVIGDGFAGHGLGRRMHESPSVPFVGKPGTGALLLEGMVITIEPAIVEHSPEWKIDPDGWSVRTIDGGWAAQWEHTVMVSRRGTRILSTA